MFQSSSTNETRELLEKQQQLKAKLIELNKSIQDKLKNVETKPNDEESFINAKLNDIKRKFEMILSNLDLTKYQTHINNILNGDIDKYKLIPLCNTNVSKTLLYEHVCVFGIKLYKLRCFEQPGRSISKIRGC